MANFELVMPKLGESIIEATIVRWHKKEGDQVVEDESIADLATDKVDSEIPSPVEGIVTKLFYKEGDVVPVGKIIAIINMGGADAVVPAVSQSNPAPEAKEVKSWKVELQKLADETGMDISVSHYPPGTSKWNKIEHRLFSYISENWRGQPLISREVIINLISNTKTQNGLLVKCDIDTNQYPTGVKVEQEALDQLSLVRESFHGEWNYTLKTRNLPHDI